MERKAADWEAFLAGRLGHRVQVCYGRARAGPIRAVGGPGGLRLRLHRGFAAAPEAVREDVAAWLVVGRRAREACRRLRAWIDAHLGPPPPARRRPAALDVRGRAHDLGELARDLFGGEFRLDFAAHSRPAVTWGRRSRSRARRSLTLGSYDPAIRLVRIHPVLDHLSVPAWFVRFILFHEILHAALPGLPHAAPAFRSREQAYPDYTRALRYERGAIRGLIRRARAGT